MSRESFEQASISGTTTRFAGNGRKLGYPTANIASDTELRDGVYFGYATIADYVTHPAMIFIGTPTTVGDTERRVEAHLLNIADTDLYDQELTLRLEHYYRPNLTFDGIEKLVAAMHEDELASREWFAEHTAGGKN